jgi:hypothetical protein
MARRFIWIGLVAGMVLMACGDIDRAPRQPNERPVAVLVAPSEVGVGEIAILDASASSDPDGGITSYRFMPGETEEELITAEPFLEYTYSAVGDYTITLTVVDNRGGKDSTAATISVMP